MAEEGLNYRCTEDQGRQGQMEDPGNSGKLALQGVMGKR